ncbi:hypothetical protein UM93_07560 [Psychromicrobium lacuslunae]|uniref:Alpha integrin n=2 Tax=Psychromicrobium lacuslunae TaxID=1618207 RepID=A0A0D4BYJ2_9MICC|nr:hypothetical protein UM93_07560 [Psychromicrobium lacuslunae]
MTARVAIGALLLSGLGLLPAPLAGAAEELPTVGDHVPATELSSAQLTEEACYVPSTADDNVLKTMKSIGDQRGISYRVRLAMFETAWVESHANNLNCGDLDSVGVFQQRPAAGWGTVAQCTNVVYATNKFLDQAIPNAANYPSWSAGTVAQSVQRSAYPERYDQAQSIAEALIQRSNALGGPTIGDAGSLVAINPSGQLVNYGAKLPLVSPPNLIGPGWADFKSVHVTDWNNDGVLDLLAQANGGNLTIYYGSSNGGFNNPLQIGHGWANLDIQIAKFDGPNTYPGIIAKTNTGALLFYPNLGSNKIGNPRTIGSGWNNISDFTTLDWNNDGATDVIGIQASTGDLIAYVKNGGNTFESQKIGQGWTGIRIQAITSFNGTGTKGLLATKTDGTLHYYPITGTTFGTPSQIGNGWNTMKIAGH